MCPPLDKVSVDAVVPVVLLRSCPAACRLLCILGGTLLFMLAFALVGVVAKVGGYVGCPADSFFEFFDSI